jgi:hypothetical protein
MHSCCRVVGSSAAAFRFYTSPIPGVCLPWVSDSPSGDPRAENCPNLRARQRAMSRPPPVGLFRNEAAEGEK